MLPIRFSERPVTFPWMTAALVSSNIVVFAMQLWLGPEGEKLILGLGFVPDRLANPPIHGYALWESVVTVVTSLFLHGGIIHLGGNMVYLWVFGGKVEERFGAFGQLALYIGSGAGGNLLHGLVFSGSEVPTIGASGCVAGILGATLMLHRNGKVVALFPLLVSWILLEIPAIVYLPIWFLLQFLSGWMSLASASGTEQAIGVAWWAHIGGFVIGLLMSLPYRRGAAESQGGDPVG